jgi:nucleotide-binding universal stress UspA family protein
MEHPMSHGVSAGNRASVPNVLLRRSSIAPAPASNVARLALVRPELARPSHRVLLAHDLTGASEIALVRAARLTLERGGHLTILHVVDSELAAPLVEAQRANAGRHIETELRRWLGGRELSYRIDIGIGDPAGAIAARAGALEVDLVVTGRHRRTSGNGTVMCLLQRMERPVLAVGSPNQSPYRRVLIPFDRTSASAERIRLVAGLLPQASLHLLHPCKRRFHDYVAPLCTTFSRGGESEERSEGFGPAPRQALSAFIENLRLGERRPIVTTEDGDSLLLVRKELAREKMDLLVLGAHAPSATEHAQVETVLTSSPCDVLFLSPGGVS